MVDHSHKPKSFAWPKLGLLVAAIILGGVVYWYWGDRLTLDALVEREEELRSFYRSHPVWTYAGAFCIYVVVCGLSLPGAATALSLLCAWLFGFWRALVLVSFASTSGAALAFLLSRYLFRDAILARFHARLVGVQEALVRDGAFYLFTLRLIPAVPFFLINLLMGLTPMRLTTFWWVSQLGMLPGTSVYVYAGASVPTLSQIADQGVRSAVSPQLLVALAILGVLPLLSRKIIRWLQSKKAAE
jgi:uncharacterized membrane protein YdjX (TVP38/TMEM64 family)